MADVFAELTAAQVPSGGASEALIIRRLNELHSVRRVDAKLLRLRERYLVHQQSVKHMKKAVMIY